MKIWSIATTEKGQQLIQIEIAIVPGLPRVLVTGLPDQMIKESALRLKTIFRNLGLPWPKSKTIMFHLKPSDLPKSGNMLELGMAMGLLIRCGHFKWEQKHLIAAGSLNFDGSIELAETPQTLAIPEGLLGTPVWMNCSESSSLFEIIRAQKLNELDAEISRLPQAELKIDTESSRELTGFRWPKSFARIASVMAHGSHSALLLGSAGIGKSTFARLVHRCLPAPSEATAKEIQFVHQRFQMRAPLRPFVAPHHLLSAKTLIGGYHRLGEIHRAHGGVLCLDELFEFPMEVQDSLREPAENKQMIRIANTSLEMLPCDFLLIGTSNLCRCGHLGIGAEEDACQCSRLVKRTGLNRFSGPLMDRFEMIVHCDSLKREEDLVSIEDILKPLAQNPAVNPAPLAETEEVPLEIPPLYSKLIDLHRLSRRRAKAFERVCRTLAASKAEPLQTTDFEWAFELTVNAYTRLQHLRNEV